MTHLKHISRNYRSPARHMTSLALAVLLTLNFLPAVFAAESGNPMSLNQVTGQWIPQMTLAEANHRAEMKSGETREIPEEEHESGRRTYLLPPE